jgi:NAD-dependent deacetylase
MTTWREGILRSQREEAVRILRASRTAGFTGAGISVASGIPDFRSDGGLWERFDPMEYATLDAFRRDPAKVWRFLRDAERIVQQARPNEAHEAFAALDRAGHLSGVITQNFDLLHERTGVRDVVRYHGALDELHCIWCGARYPSGSVKRDTDGVPYCQCGRALKPSVVLFGEEIPSSSHDGSSRILADAETMLIVGTSGSVEPAATIPRSFEQGGGRIIEIGLRPPRPWLDERRIFLRAPASELLPELIDEALGGG